MHYNLALLQTPSTIAILYHFFSCKIYNLGENLKKMKQQDTIIIFLRLKLLNTDFLYFSTHFMNF